MINQTQLSQPAQANVATDPPVKKTTVSPPPSPAQPPPTTLKPDILEIKSLPQDPHKQTPLQLFNEPKASNPWKVSSMHVNFGYIVRNDILHTGPMKLQNEAYGTDLTITGMKQAQRTSFEYLKIQKGQRFAPDEPQFNLGVNLGFENKYGLELDVKHNKITAAGYDQTVHFEGQMNGEEVNYDAPLNTYMQQHEQTLGNMEISVLGTRSFDLPAPHNHRFSFITKAGPSILTANTRTTLLNPDGQFENETSSLALTGYGFEIENALRYELGPKTGRLGIEVGHAFSYLNFSNYSTVGGGTGSHDALASQFTVKLSKTIPFKK
jgi:hypothetical protein